MANAKSWTLTDTKKNVWIEKVTFEEQELGLPNCSVSKINLRGGLQDGVDLIEVRNGDLSYSILPTRGMGIWKGRYREIPLGWESPVKGPVHPKFVNQLDRGGLGWLHGFDEWIVRCGLDSNGAPGGYTVLDNNGNPYSVNLTLHGKIANLPAHFVEVRSDPDTQLISVIGEVDESALFCPGLRLRTRVTSRAGSNSLTISDEIVNLKSVPSELELIYHCNFGGPFLEGGAQLVAPLVEVAPRDPRAAVGMSDFDKYLPPTPGYVEQVYFYDLAANSAGYTLGVLRNGSADKAAALRYKKSDLPCFTQWKNTAAESDGYVTGLEPGTNFPNSKSFERQKGRVVCLAPEESYRCELTIEVCDNRSQVAAIVAEIEQINKGTLRKVHQSPDPRFSPV